MPDTSHSPLNTVYSGVKKTQRAPEQATRILEALGWDARNDLYSHKLSAPLISALVTLEEVHALAEYPEDERQFRIQSREREEALLRMEYGIKSRKIKLLPDLSFNRDPVTWHERVVQSHAILEKMDVLIDHALQALGSKKPRLASELNRLQTITHNVLRPYRAEECAYEGTLGLRDVGRGYGNS
ncbi:MAG: hypothetical protein K2Q12_09710 [Rickettsiales bacterium]|nr:hypothetical protein [Rickettsiales bacterium]